MFKLSDAHHFRKVVAGICMITAPMLFLVAAIVSPALDTDEGALIASAAGDMDRWLISSICGFAGLVLFLPAVLALMHMLRERGTAFGHVGGALALIGFAGAFANAALGFVVWQMAASGADQAEMTALLQRLGDTAGSAAPLMFLAFALSAGLIVLAWGLVRAHAATVLQAGAVAIAAVLYAIAAPAAMISLYIVGSAFLLVGLGSMGWGVLAESDADWEHTPEVHRFRPVIGSR